MDDSLIIYLSPIFLACSTFSDPIRIAFSGVSFTLIALPINCCAPTLPSKDRRSDPRQTKGPRSATSASDRRWLRYVQ